MCLVVESDDRSKGKEAGHTHNVKYAVGCQFKAMTDGDPLRVSGSHKTDVSATASAGELIMLFQTPIISKIMANPSTRQLKSFSSQQNRANHISFLRSLEVRYADLPAVRCRRSVFAAVAETFGMKGGKCAFAAGARLPCVDGDSRHSISHGSRVFSAPRKAAPSPQ